LGARRQWGFSPELTRAKGLGQNFGEQVKKNQIFKLRQPQVEQKTHLRQVGLCLHLRLPQLQKSEKIGKKLTTRGCRTSKNLKKLEKD